MIEPELVERMVAFIRDLATATSASPIFRKAAEIAALLPEPVDPDMMEAREVVCRYHHDKHPESPWHQGQAERVRSGRNDNMLDVLAAYHGIKRGRELEKSS